MMGSMTATADVHIPPPTALAELHQAMRRHAFQLPAAAHWSDLAWHELLLDQLICSAGAGRDAYPIIGLVVPEQQQIYLSLEHADLLQHAQTQAVLHRLAVEAAKFGVPSLYLRCPRQHRQGLQQLGWSAVPGEPTSDDESDHTAQHEVAAETRLQLSLRDYRQAWQHELLSLCTTLGIDSDYGARHRLRLQAVPDDLTDMGQDCFQRPQQASAATAQAWFSMQLAAAADDVTLHLVSAWRSYQQQAAIVRRKLAAGQSLYEILRVSAAPGFSEHHSGRALDLNTPDCQALETEFANTSAYAWLRDNAVDYGFIESYPQHNHHQLAWEPWHWCYRHEC